MSKEGREACGGSGGWWSHGEVTGEDEVDGGVAEGEGVAGVGEGDDGGCGAAQVAELAALLEEASCGKKESGEESGYNSHIKYLNNKFVLYATIYNYEGV